jgi:hypothetical protein
VILLTILKAEFPFLKEESGGGGRRKVFCMFFVFYN